MLFFNLWKWFLNFWHPWADSNIKVFGQLHVLFFHCLQLFPVLCYLVVAVVENQVIDLLINLVCLRALVADGRHCTLGASPLVEGHVFVAALFICWGLHWVFICCKRFPKNVQRGQQRLCLWEGLSLNYLLLVSAISTIFATEYSRVRVADIFSNRCYWFLSAGFNFTFRGA